LERELDSMAAGADGAERVTSIVAEAVLAVGEWLHEGWIEAPRGLEALEGAKVDVIRDWYGPHWIVRLTMDDPPWFGDSIVVEVEELEGGRFQCTIPCPSDFHRTNIECCHRQGKTPPGHWSLNHSPKPKKGFSLASHEEEPRLHVVSSQGSRVAQSSPSLFFLDRPRDLGWADSRHWMEEE
jgi:hypothetical protein